MINLQSFVNVNEQILVRIQAHMCKNGLYVYILHSSWASKARGAAVHICDCCRYLHQLPFLKNHNHIHVYLYNVRYIIFHSQT